jgi:hypothetical protein
MADSTIPCFEWPPAQTIEIPLPMGVSLKSLQNIANGVPNKCDLVHSLLLQLNPMLAGMACLFKMLAVMAGIMKVVDKVSVPPDPIGLAKAIIADLAPPLKELVEDCVLMLDPCKIIRMIIAILDIILNYLGCIVEAIDSILNFKAGIDLDSAQGNPVLLASMNCADKNLDTAMSSLTQAIESLRPLFDFMNPLLGLANQDPIEMPPTEVVTPSLADLAGEDPLAKIKDFIASLQQIRQTLAAVC